MEASGPRRFSLDYTASEIVAVARYLLVDHADHPAYSLIQPGSSQGLVSTATVLIDRAGYIHPSGPAQAAKEIQEGNSSTTYEVLSVLNKAAKCDPNVPQQIMHSIQELLNCNGPTKSKPRSGRRVRFSDEGDDVILNNTGESTARCNRQDAADSHFTYTFDTSTIGVHQTFSSTHEWLSPAAHVGSRVDDHGAGPGKNAKSIAKEMIMGGASFNPQQISQPNLAASLAALATLADSSIDDLLVSERAAQPSAAQTSAQQLDATVKTSSKSPVTISATGRPHNTGTATCESPEAHHHTSFMEACQQLDIDDDEAFERLLRRAEATVLLDGCQRGFNSSPDAGVSSIGPDTCCQQVSNGADADLNCLQSVHFTTELAAEIPSPCWTDDSYTNPVFAATPSSCNSSASLPGDDSNKGSPTSPGSFRSNPLFDAQWHTTQVVTPAKGWEFTTAMSLQNPETTSSNPASPATGKCSGTSAAQGSPREVNSASGTMHYSAAPEDTAGQSALQGSDFASSMEEKKHRLRVAAALSKLQPQNMPGGSSRLQQEIASVFLQPTLLGNSAATGNICIPGPASLHQDPANSFLDQQPGTLFAPPTVAPATDTPHITAGRPELPTAAQSCLEDVCMQLGLQVNTFSIDAAAEVMGGLGAVISNHPTDQKSQSAVSNCCDSEASVAAVHDGIAKDLASMGSLTQHNTTTSSTQHVSKLVHTDGLSQVVASDSDSPEMGVEHRLRTKAAAYLARHGQRLTSGKWPSPRNPSLDTARLLQQAFTSSAASCSLDTSPCISTQDCLLDASTTLPDSASVSSSNAAPAAVHTNMPCEQQLATQSKMPNQCTSAATDSGTLHTPAQPPPPSSTPTPSKQQPSTPPTTPSPATTSSMQRSPQLAFLEDAQCSGDMQGNVHEELMKMHMPAHSGWRIKPKTKQDLPTSPGAPNSRSSGSISHIPSYWDAAVQHSPDTNQPVSVQLSHRRKSCATQTAQQEQLQIRDQHNLRRPTSSPSLGHTRVPPKPASSRQEPSLLAAQPGASARTPSARCPVSTPRSRPGTAPKAAAVIQVPQPHSKVPPAGTVFTSASSAAGVSDTYTARQQLRQGLLEAKRKPKRAAAGSIQIWHRGASASAPWRERDVQRWLERLGIQLPSNEAAPFLQNPFRNGVLLCQLAAALTATSVKGAMLRPSNIRAARANILAALEQLGMWQKPCLQSGCSPAQQVEAILQGSSDAIWELLALIRENFEPDVRLPTTAGYATMGFPVTTAAATTTASSKEGGPPSGQDFNAEDLLTRPTYREVTLPYSTQQLKLLEKSLVSWLHDLGLLQGQDMFQGFDSILQRLADGTLLCDLVKALMGTPVKGALKRALTPKARSCNIRKALEALQPVRNMSKRYLCCEEALCAGNRAALTGLLEDLHRMHDRLPPRPTQAIPGEGPYLPYFPQLTANNPRSPRSNPRSTPTCARRPAEQRRPPTPARPPSTTATSAERQVPQSAGNSASDSREHSMAQATSSSTLEDTPLPPDITPKNCCPSSGTVVGTRAAASGQVDACGPTTPKKSATQIAKQLPRSKAATKHQPVDAAAKRDAVQRQVATPRKSTKQPLPVRPTTKASQVKSTKRRQQQVEGHVAANTEQQEQQQYRSFWEEIAALKAAVTTWELVSADDCLSAGGEDQGEGSEEAQGWSISASKGNFDCMEYELLDGAKEQQELHSSTQPGLHAERSGGLQLGEQLGSTHQSGCSTGPTEGYPAPLLMIQLRKDGSPVLHANQTVVVGQAQQGATRVIQLEVPAHSHRWTAS